MTVTRRDVLSGAVTGCLFCAATSAMAKVLPTTLQPLVGENYHPADDDERGMWQSLGRFEEDLAQSDLVLRPNDLQAYTASVIERLTGRPATEFRIYVVRDASFNAAMFPNGLMIVNTGLLSRIDDEAQFAAVLGHESGHYFRKHSIENWRSLRTKSAVGAFVTVGVAAVAGYSTLQGYSGQTWLELASSVNQLLLLSVLQFSRAQETEADAYGIELMARSGYTPGSAAQMWRQLIEERMASAREHDKKYQDDSNSVYSTHPPTGERMENLTETAAFLERQNELDQASDRREEWRRAIQPHFASLLEEQVRLNDPGASLYLIERRARDGWTGVLYYYQGEAYRLRNKPGDGVLAAQSYAAAVALPDAPPEAWRANGYALIKAGRRDEGKQSLSRYLELQPAAKDAAMVRFSLAQ